MESKRYYWLKFRSDFFDSKRIKKLRNMAGGDTYCIIYLKMQLKALKTGGVLEYTGIEEQFADELALEMAFEGTRYYDLMRIARHRNNVGEEPLLGLRSRRPCGWQAALYMAVYLS